MAGLWQWQCSLRTRYATTCHTSHIMTHVTHSKSISSSGMGPAVWMHGLGWHINQSSKRLKSIHPDSDLLRYVSANYSIFDRIIQSNICMGRMTWLATTFLYSNMLMLWFASRNPYSVDSRESLPVNCRFEDFKRNFITILLDKADQADGCIVKKYTALQKFFYHVQFFLKTKILWLWSIVLCAFLQQFFIWIFNSKHHW